MGDGVSSLHVFIGLLHRADEILHRDGGAVGLKSEDVVIVREQLFQEHVDALEHIRVFGLVDQTVYAEF